jgi:Skp family chaperone for outer membrane proteins
MHPLAKQFLITFAAVALALGSYAIYQHAQQAESRRQIEALNAQSRNDAEQLRQQAEALGAQTHKDSEALRQHADALSEQATALKTQVDNEHRQAAADRERYLRASYLSEGLMAAASGKTAIAEYYLTNGQLPRSNREVGIPEPEQFKGRSLRRLEVSARGILTLSYDETSGVADGTIQMIPDVGNSAMGIQWRCITPSYPEIAVSIPQCEYRPIKQPSNSG